MAKRGRKKKFKVSFNVSPSTLRSILAVALLLFSALVIISFFTPDYYINQKLHFAVKRVFGHAAWVMPVLTAILGLVFIDSLKNKIKEMRVVVGLALFMISLSGIFHIFVKRDMMKQAALDGKGGGLLGYFIFKTLRDMISIYGAVVVLFGLVVVSVILIFNTSIDEFIELYRDKIKAGELFKFGKKDEEDRIEVQEGMAEFEDVDAQMDELKSDDVVTEKKPEDKFEIISTMSEPQVDIVSGVPMTGDDGRELGTLNPGGLPYPDVVWKLPGPDLLLGGGGNPPDVGDIEKNKKIIIRTLESFNVNGVEVADVQVGPTVTKYALSPPAGVRINAVANLQYDIARALSSPTGEIRVEAPIPGTSLIGLEVPNRTRAIVDFKSLIYSDPMENAKSKLMVVLGTDVGGVTHVYDIGEMPHLLVAGQTGSGKSIFLHNLIMSLVYRATPQEVKFIIVDPKRVELIAYEDIPHLYTPIIVEKERAVAVFGWAVSEMNRRYKMFQSARVSNIHAYNEKSGFQALPYVVIIVDEFTEIMIEDPSAIEKRVVRLAQLARATGIHLVLAAQRPQADVITGLIKANIPCRIAFAVASNQDSRIIIDQKGAEKLLGKGDMLFLPPDKPNPTRLQGALIRKEERVNVVEFLKGQGMPPEYKDEILEAPSDEDKGKSIAAGGESTDEFYDEAMEIVIASGKGSASLLQRRLSIGYARAARIIDELEKNGVVGPSRGSRAREVLVDSMPMSEGEDLPDISEDSGDLDFDSE